MNDLISRKKLLEAYDKAHKGPPGGARKLIEEAPEAVVHCKDCCHWKPPHIVLPDGKQRAYKEGDTDGDPLGMFVSSDVGVNWGGRCWLEHNRGYGRDMRIFRNEDDYCSRAEKRPDGFTAEAFWGLTTEPNELLPD